MDLLLDCKQSCGGNLSYQKTVLNKEAALPRNTRLAITSEPGRLPSISLPRMMCHLPRGSTRSPPIPLRPA